VVYGDLQFVDAGGFEAFESMPRDSSPSRRAFRSALRALVECNLRREGKEDPWSTGTLAIVHAGGFGFLNPRRGSTGVSIDVRPTGSRSRGALGGE